MMETWWQVKMFDFKIGLICVGVILGLLALVVLWEGIKALVSSFSDWNYDRQSKKKYGDKYDKK